MALERARATLSERFAELERPDGGIWWSLVEKYKVNVMFSAPTAIRVLKKQDPALLKKYDLSSLRALFLAGEPLDEPTAKWIADALGKPIIDNYWQTETGWPILSLCSGLESPASKFGSPGKAVYGYNVKLLDDQTGEELTGANQKGVLAIIQNFAHHRLHHLAAVAR